MKPKKRIVIFCDGTWGKLSGKWQTHIPRLSQTVLPTATDNISQYVFYQEGVGTGRGWNVFARVMDKFFGGILGLGLDVNLAEAYRHLVYWYEPGDEVFIFGFSRGAYTARSLGGLVRRIGIMPRTHLDRLPEAIGEYRRRDKADDADDPYFLEKRRELSPLTATSEKDLEWRKAQGDHDSIFLKLAYIGVFDTVGALGLPGILGVFAKCVNKKYQFHDTKLSRMVRAARHAVAIDEERRLYPPTLWTNIEFLNGDVTGHERPYLQDWFPGNHGVVGGSGQAPALAQCSAAWIVEGARAMGLGFDQEQLDRLIADADPSEPVPEGFVPRILNTWLGRKFRKVRTQLNNVDDVSETAVIRYQTVPEYRPQSLVRLADDFGKGPHGP